MKHSISYKFAAFAAASAMMLAMPAIAAENESNNASATSVPSAIDSSQRVIRLAQPNSAPAATATASPNPNNTSVDTARSIMGNNASSTVNTPANTSFSNPSIATAQPSNTNLSNAPLANTPTYATSRPQAVSRPQMEQTPVAKIYERGPVVTTGIDITKGQLAGIPVPKVQVSDATFVPTIVIAQTQGPNADKLDVSLLDYFIDDVSPNVRHYPPNFPNRSQRYYTREKIKILTDWIKPYAENPNASYDVLIRAAKLNGMGRNLDLGSEYAVRAGQYVDRAIKIDPQSGEANFLYGMMLAEGGGFKEGEKYLDRAVGLGYMEAEQSLAQSALLSDRREEALDRLRRLQQQTPNNDIIPKQIRLIEDGKYYIWDIPAPDINVEPTT